jgi:hypothetical protein
LRRYLATDLPEINAWYAARGLPEVPSHALPEIGFLVPGIAAAFLYRTDSSIAFMDGAVTCPTAPLRERFAAIHGIGEALVEKAHALGIGKLLIFTQRHGMASAMKRIGFQDGGTYGLLSRKAG